MLPASIVLGGSVIAAGVYFGLSARPPSNFATTSSTVSNLAESTASATTATASPALAAIPAATGVSPVIAAAADAAAREALVAEKAKTFVPKCWKPALEKTPRPDFVKFKLNIAFDAQGKEIGRALVEDRNAPRPDVSRCIAEQTLGLRIPPPGVPVNVLIPLEFP